MEKIKVLFISDNFIYPPDKDGNASTMFNLFDNFSEQCKELLFDFLYICDHKEQIDLNPIETFFGRVFFHRENKTQNRKLKLTRTFEQNIKVEIAKGEYDVAFFGTLSAARYQLIIKKLIPKTIVFPGDCSTYVHFQRGIKKKIRHFYLPYFEKKYYKNADSVIFYSKVDADYAFKKIHRRRYTVIPLGGVDMFFSDKKTTKEFDLLFLGNLGNYPNKLAAKFIVEELLQQLVLKTKNIKIAIVGYNPPLFLNYAEEKYPNNLFVKANVSDVAPFFNSTKIFISPLFNGAGMKNKIIAAMSAGLPIVATKKSYDGIIMSKDMHIANNAQEFIARIFDVLGSDHAFSESNRKNYLNNYSWKNSAFSVANTIVSTKD